MSTPRTPRESEKKDDDKEQEKELNKKDSFKLSFDFDTLPEDVIKQNAKGQSAVVGKIAEKMKFADADHKFAGKLDAETHEIIDKQKQEKSAKQKSEIKTRSKRSSSVTEHVSDMSLFKQTNKQKTTPKQLKKSTSADNTSAKNNKRFSFK